jgi:hypothetical protein
MTETNDDERNSLRKLDSYEGEDGIVPLATPNDRLGPHKCYDKAASRSSMLA